MAYSPRSASGSSSHSSPVSRPALDILQRKTHLLAEMPVNTSKPRKTTQQPPQEAIDEFWAKFTTKTPGKATTVIPQNEFAAKVARRSASAVPVCTETSYDEAAALCKAKIDKIVQECRRVNQKYRDPHFDLEFDLKFGRRDCLESLWNVKDKKPPQSSFAPKSVKRVVDIFDNPQFYVDGPTANDVRQGRDGDCWLMAALCNLSNKAGLIEKVCVAHDQDVGVYGFVFHRDGEWISEIIDDKLYLTKPDYDEGHLERILWEDRERANSEESYRRIYQSNSGALYFAQCEHPNETWLPLLEKAYAKAHGDYASIEGGITGEAIEDLTGGVTSEIYTTDILDKEYFWKEKLLKVNQECLLGCSTGFASRGWGERKGIIEMHAYSVMKAVEIENKRLVLLKNPWGKGEWKGPWSDGSQEWTPEWLKRLDHKFGDDGAFWISYQDLLKKYNIFDVTRLFGPDWKVTSIWTTLSVPWTLGYHDTHYFAFTISKSGPVVLVLAQLDERYFKGLEGQYRFDLQFRLHKADQEDYVVRSQASYRMNRSVNVELDLEAGSYKVFVRLDAVRNDQVLPIEQVIRSNAKGRREKLIRIGLAYDLAHSKGKLFESADYKAARDSHAEKQRERRRAEIKRKIQEERELSHYSKVRDRKKKQRQTAKRNAKHRVRVEKMKAALKPGIVQAANCSDYPERLEAEGTTRASIQPPRPAMKKHVLIQGLDSATEDLSISERGELGTEASHADSKKVEVQQETSSVMSKGHAATPQESEEVKGEATGPADISRQNFCESEGDDLSSLSSLSDLSDRDWEIRIGARERSPAERRLPPPATSATSPDDLDEFEKDPWNAVAVVGLRVYYRVPEGSVDEVIVKLRVVRPNPFAEQEMVRDDDPVAKEPIGLDVDDSAKDATLDGEIKQRKRSIAPASEDLRDASTLAR
ncbi:calpain family cysteine protease [Colletotrichum musicola]|uniref:Calpain family cysteine protease n=1 Tax=Colletotrichum musicola TaxID=2175873 RepID=A0A8H6KPI3_9PEZI|nr:calpain family cysteine protease [Colletotrichum musicola]